MKLEGKKINFLGDSITEGLKTSGPHARYTNLIEKECGAVCRNYGISGTRIARQKKPSASPLHDRYYLSRVPEMDPDADIVCVFGGTNDFGHGDAPLGDMSDRTVDTFYGALHLLVLGLLEKYPNARIVFFTPMHRTCEDSTRGDGSKPEGSQPLRVYVEAIREVMEYYSLPVLDLFAASGLQPRVDIIREMFVPDGLHPNDAGQVRLKDVIVSFLESL